AFTLIKNFIRQFFWLTKHFKKADAVYCWFSDYHGFLPVLFARIFNKPMITVLGGFDCNKFQELGYGIFCSSWRAPLGTYILRNSTLLLPVDEYLIATSEKSKHWGEAHPNGVKNNLSNFITPWEALPTGYASQDWEAGPNHREKIVSTVALVSNQRTALIKGWDLFIEVAKLKPDFEFIIAGISPDFTDQFIKQYSPPPNLQFIPPQPRENLSEIYQKTSVYLQLSRAEGLPNVLCEAMLCGCVSVGSPVFGIPDAIGDAGFVAEKPDPEEIAKLVEMAHSQAETLRIKARKRIIEKFSIQQRKQRLKAVLHPYLNSVNK
ncbi:MAG: glycosyltransferase family 4 protein, partial [Candidatus Paceibacterota bacterium]